MQCNGHKGRAAIRHYANQPEIFANLWIAFVSSSSTSAPGCWLQTGEHIYISPVCIQLQLAGAQTLVMTMMMMMMLMTGLAPAPTLRHPLSRLAATPAAAPVHRRRQRRVYCGCCCGYCCGCCWMTNICWRDAT